MNEDYNYWRQLSDLQHVQLISDSEYTFHILNRVLLFAFHNEEFTEISIPEQQIASITWPFLQGPNCNAKHGQSCHGGHSRNKWNVHFNWKEQKTM